MFDTIKKNFQQENDDLLYEYVMEEMESKEPLKGLWAKAIAHSEGNNDKAKSLYIQYRVQAVKDECKSAGVSFSKLSKEELSQTIQNGFAKVETFHQEHAKTTPLPEVEKPHNEKSHERLGGWLIFFAILLVLGDLNVIGQIIGVFTQEHQQNLHMLLNKQQTLIVTHINYATIIGFITLFFNTILTITFFIKSYHIRRIIAIVFLWNIIATIMTTWMFLYQMEHLPKEFFNAMYSPEDVIKEFIRPLGALIGLLIWFLYFKFSKRVKATFTNQKPLRNTLLFSAAFVLCLSLLYMYKYNELQILNASNSNNKEILAGVQVGDKWGFIDKIGKIVIQPTYEAVQPFSEGMAAVQLNGKWHFINRKGATVIHSNSYEINPKITLKGYFSEGPVQIKKDGKYGFIDKNGTIVIQPIYNLADDFSEGLASVRVDGKWGFIDKQGTMVIKPKFYSFGPPKFKEGLACVKMTSEEEDYGLIDTKGDWIIQPILPSIVPVFSIGEGLASVKVEDKWGFIDKQGNLIIKAQFDNVFGFENGLASVNIGGKWGFINKQGNFVIQPQFDYARNFSEGLARIQVNNKWGFIDMQGNIVIQPQFEGATMFMNGFAGILLEKEGKAGFIDKKGTIVIQPNFNKVHPFF